MTTLGIVGDLRLLSVPDDGYDADVGDGEEIVVCAAGRATHVLWTGTDAYGDQSFVTAALTARWAGVVVYAYDHYNNASLQLKMRNVETGHYRGFYLWSNCCDGPQPDIRSLAISDSAHPVVGEVVGDLPRVVAVRRSEPRVLDEGPGVDPMSVTVDGETAHWTRDGVVQSEDLQ